MLSRAGLEALDQRLASLARLEGALRLRLGQVLDALAQRDPRGAAGYAELGFSSLSAYARERAERSPRWAEAARCMARRLEALSRIRRAVAAGSISWSMAEQVARIATPADEAEWLSRAERMTVREMRRAVKRELEQRSGSAINNAADPASTDRDEMATRAAARDEQREHADERVTLRLMIDQEDEWLWRATKTLMEVALDTVGAEEQVSALLGEASSTLVNALPAGAIDWSELSELVPGWRDPRDSAYVRQRLEWQEQAEVSCEGRVARGMKEQPPAPVGDELFAALCGSPRRGDLGSVTLAGLPPNALDREVRTVARGLATQDLELARGLLRLHREDGWRRLGYASERQYATERLGLSRSLVTTRRALALKLEKLPAIADALERGVIGVEAAVAIAKIATPATEQEWIERATRRTIKHLNEETDAAGMAARVSGVRDCPPPTPAELETYFELERAVVSGKILAGGPVQTSAALLGAAGVTNDTTSADREAWHRSLGRLIEWLERGIQTSAGPRRPVRETRSAGRVEVSLRMSRASYAAWHALEAEVRRALRLPMSFLKFLCAVFWEENQHVLGGATSVMVRDRCRCSSPVCSRHDVQAHHLRFRSQGGGDEPSNLAGLCVRCHLRGVHEGRLSASGFAERIRWTIGRVPLLVVEGREKRAA